MTDVFEVSRVIPIRQAIDDIELLIECCDEDEWEGKFYICL